MKKIVRLTENDLNSIISKVLNENTSLQDKILKTIDRIGLLKTIETIGYNTFKKMIPLDSIDRDKKIELINFICKYEDDTIYFDGLTYYEIVISEESVEDGISIESIYSIENNYVNVRTTIYNEEGDIISEPYGNYLIPINKLDNKIIDNIFDVLIEYYNKIKRENTDLVVESNSIKDKILNTIDRIGILKTIEAIGYDTFKKILPEYLTKENKIDILNSIPEIKEGVALYDLIDGDIVIESRDTDEGEEVDYITYIEDGYVTVSTYEFYADGEMNEESIYNYGQNFNELSDDIFNILFYRIVDNYFR